MKSNGDMNGETSEHGPDSAAISNAVVQVTRRHTGRGPTKAKTYVNRDAVTVILQDTLTHGEQSLVANGQGDHVLRTRKLFQNGMREELVAAVEELTERKVIAFLSDNTLEPDVAIEAFVLQSLPRE